MEVGICSDNKACDALRKTIIALSIELCWDTEIVKRSIKDMPKELLIKKFVGMKDFLLFKENMRIIDILLDSDKKSEDNQRTNYYQEGI